MTRPVPMIVRRRRLPVGAILLGVLLVAGTLSVMAESGRSLKRGHVTS